MAETTKETVTAEKKETAKKSSRTTSKSSTSKSTASKSSSGKSGSKSTGSRSAASRNSSARSNSGRGGNRNSGGNRGRGANSTANKVYKHSPIAIACYVLAGAMLLYASYIAGNTFKQVSEYFAAYGMPATAKDYISYVAQAMLDPLMHAFTFFMAGYILTAVRKLDPKNYVPAKPAKKPEAKKEDNTVEFSKPAEKTETKVAKVADEKKKAVSETEKKEETTTKSAKEEFEESLEAELKKEEEKA